MYTLEPFRLFCRASLVAPSLVAPSFVAPSFVAPSFVVPKFRRASLNGVPEMNVRSLIVFSGLAILALAALPVPSARAGDEVRSDSSCPELWAARNQIYKDAGYCFKTARAREHFGNGGCMHDNVDAVPLSDADRRYISQIKKLEAQKGC